MQYTEKMCERLVANILKIRVNAEKQFDHMSDTGAYSRETADELLEIMARCIGVMKEVFKEEGRFVILSEGKLFRCREWTDKQKKEWG